MQGRRKARITVTAIRGTSVNELFKQGFSMSSYPAELTIESAPVAEARHDARWAPLVNLYRPKTRGFLVLFAYLLVAYVIYLGWHNRLTQPLTAESGLGYTLGIIGGTLMLLLLLYPLRKHLRIMRHLGPIKYWFRAHMLFGIVGPVCILFHSGFQLGSLNSNVALFCMLVVASSGLVGRYFYTKIHHGLYGRKATLDELLRHSALLGESLQAVIGNYPSAAEHIRTFEQQSRNHPAGFVSSLITLISLGVRTWLLYLSLWLHAPRSLPGHERRRVLRHVGARLESIRKIAEFHFYERMFSAWHLLHFPLFLMLVVSGIVHVIAVHMY
jgi:hypothetical protein